MMYIESFEMHDCRIWVATCKTSLPHWIKFNDPLKRGYDHCILQRKTHWASHIAQPELG